MKSDSTKASQRTVLFCILNWGLGHASRCIPIIKALTREGHTIILASDGRAGALLRKEFPLLDYISLPGYDVRYPFFSMRRNLFYQWPRIVRAIWKEHQVIRRVIRERKVDTIISDNRYGCYAAGMPNIIITHQIHPRTGGPWTDIIASKFSGFLLSYFDQVWIPDDEAHKITGHMTKNPPPGSRFVGWLSRFESNERDISTEGVLVILSGPEPARTRLETRLKSQLSSRAIKARFVLGKTEGTQQWRSLGKTMSEVDYLTSDALEGEILKAQCVICRAGYSSIMDMLVLGKRAIMIPTPGQYEQEYLSKTIEMDLLHFIEEKNLDLANQMSQCTDGAQKTKGKP